jgi:hypothetical protein
VLYHYIQFFPCPLIHSNFHTIYPYFSRLYITPHSTFHVVIGCAEHSGAQVKLHGERENFEEYSPNLAFVEFTFPILINYLVGKC